MLSPQFCTILAEVALCGNITAAAEKMNYTQGAFSHAIKRAEEEVGFKIFKRSKYGVSLTAEGQALLPIAKKISEYGDKMDETIASLHSLDYGHIKLGTYATMSMQFLPDALKKFSSAYPGIKIELIEGSAREISSWLADQTIDIALTSIHKYDNFEKIFLFDEPLVALFPKDTEPELESDGTFSIGSFAHYSFIAPMMDKRMDPDMLPAVLSVPWELRMHVSSCDFISIMCLIRSGLGTSYLPLLVTNDYRKYLNIYMTNPLYYRAIGLGLRSSDECSLASKKFIEYLKDYTVRTFIPEHAGAGIKEHDTSQEP